jgi:hypothetical protein
MTRDAERLSNHDASTRGSEATEERSEPQPVEPEGASEAVTSSPSDVADTAERYRVRPCERPMMPAPDDSGMSVSLFGIEDPVFLLIAAFLVIVFLAIFLVFRRTLVGFKEGMERGKR